MAASSKFTTAALLVAVLGASIAAACTDVGASTSGCIHDANDLMTEQKRLLDRPWATQTYAHTASTVPTERKFNDADAQPVRIVFDTLGLTQAGAFCAAASGTVPDYRTPGATVNCVSGTELTSDKRDILTTKILPLAINRIAQFMSVERIVGNLMVPSTDVCGDVPVPSAHTTTGVPNADLVLYVTAVPISSFARTFAGACRRDQNRRHIVGKINFNPVDIAWSATDNEANEKRVRRAMHEIFHVLGVSTIEMFLGDNKQLVSKRGRQATVSVYPTVVSFARSFTGCSTLEGGEFENEGPCVTVSTSSHWERRVWFEEMMTMSYGSQVSGLTLGFLNDINVGWVTRQADKENMYWGNGMGCGLHDNTCATAAGGLGSLFCGNTGDTANHCTYDFGAIGSCGAQQWMDGCNMVIPFSNRHCSVASPSTDDDLKYPHTFSRTSRCFNGSDIHRTDFNPNFPNYPRCLEAKCDGGSLSFTVPNQGTTYASCPSKGAAVDTPGAEYTGQAICPEPADMCRALSINPTLLTTSTSTSTTTSAPGATSTTSAVSTSAAATTTTGAASTTPAASTTTALTPSNSPAASTTPMSSMTPPPSPSTSTPTASPTPSGPANSAHVCLTYGMSSAGAIFYDITVDPTDDAMGTTLDRYDLSTNPPSFIDRNKYAALRQMDPPSAMWGNGVAYAATMQTRHAWPNMEPNTEAYWNVLPGGETVWTFVTRVNGSPVNLTFRTSQCNAVSLPPTPPPQCECHGHGTSYPSPANSSQCVCYCNYPYTGPSCTECYLASDFYDPATNTCVSCFQDPQAPPSQPVEQRSIVVPSGERAFYPLTVRNPKCLNSGLRALYYGDSENGRFTDILPTGIWVSSTCNVPRSDGYYYAYLNSLYVVGNSYTYLGPLNCAPEYNVTVPSPAAHRVHVHLVSAQYEDLAMAASLVRRLLANGVAAVTFSHFRQAAAGSEAVTNHTAFAERVSQLYPQSQGGAVCGLFASDAWGNASATVRLEASVPAGTTEVIVVGSTSTACNTAADDLAAVARRARIAWASLEPPRQLRYVFPAAYTHEAPWMVQPRLNAFFAPPPATCDLSQLAFPSQVAAFDRDLVTLGSATACNITQCCFGSHCQRFVENRGLQGCITPLLSRTPTNPIAVSVQTTAGAANFTTVIAAPSSPQHSALRLRDEVPNTENPNSTTQQRYTMSDRVYAFSVRRGNICCRFVGITFDGRVAGTLGGEESCFPAANASSGVLSAMYLPVPSVTSANRFGAIVRSVALQCGEARAADPSVVDGMSYPVTHDSVAGAENPTTPAYAPNTDVNRERIDKYVAWALQNTLAASQGAALKHVRVALNEANLRSSLASEWRPCSAASDVPDVNGRCEYAWTAAAADAGAHLVSAGFTPIASDWELSNSRRGDIVVLPRVSSAAGPSGAFSTDVGAIAIKHSDSAADGWVGDVRHGYNIYPSQRQRTGYAGTPTLYRLVGVVEEHPYPAEDTTLIQAAVEATPDREAYCRAFNDRDQIEYPQWQQAVDIVNSWWACPAVLEKFSRPRELLGHSQVDGLGLNYSTYCFLASPDVIDVPLTHGMGVRCCYDLQYNYIPGWPSKMYFEDMQEGRNAFVQEAEAERVCCGASMAKDSQACLAYRDRRPATAPTNAPFTSPQRWTEQTASGAGFGDPHCSTYDGVDYECNYHGEATWSACNAWAVHAIAEPVGAAGKATAITKFAVRANATTVAVAITGTTVPGAPLYTMTIDGDAHLGSFRNADLTVSLDGPDGINVVDAAGNLVTASVSRSMVALTTAPARSCRGIATGLTGNFNGDRNDDLTVPGTTRSLANASAELIYRDFVRSHLVTSTTASLFPPSMRVVTNTSYTPEFARYVDLSACPAACMGVRACCFDAANGGAEFATQFVKARTALDALIASTVGFNENRPPTFVRATTLVTVGSGSPAAAAPVQLASYRADDSDNVASLTCSVCTVPGYSCAVTGVGSPSAELVVWGAAPTAPGGFSCLAVDGRGASARASTAFVATGSLGGNGFVPQPPGGTTGTGGGDISAASPVAVFATFALAALAAAIAAL